MNSKKWTPEELRQYIRDQSAKKKKMSKITETEIIDIFNEEQQNYFGFVKLEIAYENADSSKK